MNNRIIEELFASAAIDKALQTEAIAEAGRAINEAEARGLTVTQASPVDCGFDYVVMDFYVYGRTPAGSHRRYGAIQDKPGSELWRVHGMSQTFTLAGVIRHLTAAILDGAAL